MKTAKSLPDAIAIAAEMPLPIIVSAAYTFGSKRIAHHREEVETVLALALDDSPTSDILIESAGEP